MKGRIPQGDTHSAAQLSLCLQKLHSQVIPGLYWDSELQWRNSASSTRGRTCRVPRLQTDEFNNSEGGQKKPQKRTQTVSVSVKVLRRGHSSVNTCFFERILLASDISLQEKL